VPTSSLFEERAQWLAIEGDVFVFNVDCVWEMPRGDVAVGGVAVAVVA
jgi:hypothetical protein